MAIPAWAVGQVLDASDVNTWFVPTVAVKGSNQSVTSSTALVNDTALAVAVAASAIYEISAFVLYDGDSSGDLKLGWTAPSGAVFNWMSGGLPLGATTASDNSSHTGQSVGSAAQIGCIGAGSPLVAPVTGILTTAGTAGNLQMQFAQMSSFGTATRILAGAALISTRIG
jgi:hypothetical protein